MSWCPYCKENVELITYTKNFSHITYLPFHGRTTEERSTSELKCKQCFIRILYPEASTENEFIEFIRNQMKDELPERIEDIQTKLKISLDSEFEFSYWYDHAVKLNLWTIALSFAIIITSSILLIHHLLFLTLIIGVNVLWHLWMLKMTKMKNINLDNQKAKAINEFQKRKNYEIDHFKSEIETLKALSIDEFTKEILRNNRITSLKGDIEKEEV
jgi:hypothetical protein